MTRHLLTFTAIAAAAAASTLVGRAQSGPSAREVTFTEDVAPIIFNRCASCHRPGEAAPFSLLSYADVRPRGKLIALSTRARQMPPWKADTSDYPFQGDRRLTDAQIDTIERWVNAGMPQGDPAKLPAPPTFTDGWQLGEPDLVVRMPEAYNVPEKGRDVYRNFVLPLNLKEDVWVKGVDFRPSARGAAHHSLFFLDATGAARQQDERDPEPGYSGGMGGGLTLGAGGRLALAGARGRGAAGGAGGARTSATGGTLGGWAPGAQPRLLPDDLAFFVPKGSDLILSMHFHPSGKPEKEAATVGLYFARQAPTKTFTNVQLPPIFGVMAGINIPAGESHYSISDSFVLPVDVKAFGVSAHAHYIGKTMLMTATLPGGEKKTLLSIRDWDFGWQEQYLFSKYAELPKGTRLDVTVTYDNSAANKRNPSNPPQRVTWGEQSTDEMGSVSLQVIAARQTELPVLQQALAEHVRETAVSSPIGKLLLGLAGGRGDQAR
jgi:mono/diheme cytochrome c family protein